MRRRLLNDFQRGFPLQPDPFARIAADLGTDRETVIKTLRELQRCGAVSRVGAVFRPNTVGVSTLAAMAVPHEDLEKIAAYVSEFDQVNHNYEREHRFNLWFVVTETDREQLDLTLSRIEERCGLSILVLPLVKDYHIDLGFKMELESGSLGQLEESRPDQDCSPGEENSAEDLIEALQHGLPLVSRPFEAIGNRMGIGEEQVIAELQQMIESGVIKRLGVVVRHHELGYRANAMVVWDIADSEVDHIGQLLGQQSCTTLCYQRPRREPDWPFNLFCMVHGRDRESVRASVAEMATLAQIEETDYQILFSGRRFKQRGAIYRYGQSRSAHH